MPSPHRLKHPLPRRASLPAGQGYCSVPFSESDVLSALASGAWFDFSRGQHNFDSPATRRFAGEAQATLLDLLEGALA